MPSQSPLTSGAALKHLADIGSALRQRRKALRLSAVATAEAAGMSRVTLHRIERGEASVTMGAYLNAMSALGLKLALVTPRAINPTPHSPPPEPASPHDEVTPWRVRLADFPQLERLAWSIQGAVDLTPQEALGLYERNWRHMDTQHLDSRETALIDRLVELHGKGHLLV